jgi:hypothetical protein
MSRERIGLRVFLLLGLALAAGCASADMPNNMAASSGGGVGGGVTGFGTLPPRGGAGAISMAPAIVGSGGTVALPMTAGRGGAPGPVVPAGTGGMAGPVAMAGHGGTAGMVGAGGAAGGTVMGNGMCCPDGNCLCHGPAPTALTSAAGPFKTAEAPLSTGTVYYPTDADPPFAAVAICPGFLNVGPEMAPWGPFYASHGIVLLAVSTGASDIPDIRAGLLLAGIEELKAENMKTGGPLSGKLSGRYGTSGYSMGGGGTTIAASMTATLKTSIGLAAWGGTGAGDTVPELLFCGDADTVAPCNMSDPVYAAIADSTPKMQIVVPGATHFNWFDPADAGGGMSGKYALAFQKVFLEGDTRWKPLLIMPPAGGGIQTTNIK